MDTPDEKTLRQMPYSQLKKYALINCGIKKKLKADVLIASILKKKEDDDSFVTLEQKIINSCKKHKEEKFDDDKKVDSGTPRRETYIIDSPFIDSEAMKKELIMSSASPALKKTPAAVETSLNVTMNRGSERRTRKRKVSFVTPIRKSMRLSALTPHYTSVRDRPKTPIPSRASSGRRTDALSQTRGSFSKSPGVLDMGNKQLKIYGGLEVLFATPVSIPDEIVPAEISAKVENSQKVISFSTPEVSSVKKLSRGKHTQEIIPLEGSSKKSPSLSSRSKVNKFPTPKPGKKSPARLSSSKVNKFPTPRVSGGKSAAKAQPPVSTKIQGAATPKGSGVKNKAKVQFPPNTKVQGAATPRSGLKRGLSPAPASHSKKRNVTPNFNKIHQKAFEKMESIDEYKRRKDANSAKKLKEHLKFNDPSKSNIAKKLAVKKDSKIPKTFGGIPFIPSITSIKDIKTNFASFGEGPKKTEKKKAVKSLTFIERNLSKRAASERNLGITKSVKAVSRENTPLNRKSKFDLQASLSKKLPYKPHSGPLKPLTDTTLNSTFHSISGPPQKAETKNEVVRAKRAESRGILRGVRMNRRFELQMRNRMNADA